MLDKSRKKVWYIIIPLLVVLVAVIGWRIYTNIKIAKEKAANVSKGRVVTVEVMPAFTKTITPVLTFSATLEPVWYADISPKVDGRIAALNTDEGQTVTAGQIVASLDNAELAAQVTQAQGVLYSSQADLAQAQADLQRYQALAAQGAIAAQQYQAAQTKVAALTGQVQAYQGNLAYLQARLNNADVVTPHGGVVVKRYLQAGDYAKAGQAIFNIADLSVMLAKATVGENQIGELTLGESADVIVDALNGQKFTGTITKISPAAVVPAHTFSLEVSLDNSQNLLRSGMFAKVQVKGREHPNALVVPQSALVLFEDQQTVFVLNGDQVQQRKLKLGYVGDGWAEVLSGLKPGDMVVVVGQNNIRDGSRVQVVATREAGQI